MMQRQWALWGLLALSVGSALWLAAKVDADGEVALPLPRTNSQRPGPVAVPMSAPRQAPADPLPAKPPAQLGTQLPELVRHSPPGWPASTAAGLLAWGPPTAPVAPLPAAPPPALPAPPPQAPPFPYQWIGRLDEAGSLSVWLNSADRVAVLRVGALLDSQWRLDRIDERSLQFTWLPAQLPLTVTDRNLP